MITLYCSVARYGGDPSSVRVVETLPGTSPTSADVEKTLESVGVIAGSLHVLADICLAVGARVHAEEYVVTSVGQGAALTDLLKLRGLKAKESKESQ